MATTTDAAPSCCVAAAAHAIPAEPRPITFLTAWFCPFAQRAHIALEERDAAYEPIQAMEFAGAGFSKQDILIANNPKAEVPTLLIPRFSCASSGDAKSVAIYESLVCLEYIDEAYQGGESYYPGCPVQKARAKLWLDILAKV